MKEYHKIETLFKFNQETKRWTNEFYNKNVELLKNNLWVFTEKIDGTNLRIYWDGHKLSYGGRTNRAEFSKKQINVIETFLVNTDQETIFEQNFKEKTVIVYGELFGAKIQNGGLYTDGTSLGFRVFDIEIDDVFLEYENAFELAKDLGYKTVPIVMLNTIRCGIKYVLENEKSCFSEAKLEGLVGKPVGDFRDRLGKRIVIKIKRRDLEKTDGLEAII